MGNSIEVPHDEGANGAYLAQPQGSPRAGIVVLHEWWGLNQHIRDVADRLAAEGYLTLAPDMYDGKVSNKDDEAEGLMNEYIAAAPGKAQSAFAALAKRNDVDGVGCVGLSMGGSLSLGLAIMQPALKTCVIFYGLPEEHFGQLEKIGCPTLGLFGELDQWIPSENVRQLDEELDAAGVAHEMITYPGADHDFLDDGGAAYNADAATDGWQRALQFPGEHLP